MVLIVVSNIPLDDDADGVVKIASVPPAVTEGGRGQFGSYYL
jgi:hypothetical protein